jgi:hypothetical protein
MRRLLFVLLISCTLPALAAEGPRPGNQDKPSKYDVPPPPTIAPGGSEPEVRIVNRGDQRIEEYRVNGKLYMMKVTPNNGKGKPYFLQDPEGTGYMKQVDPSQRLVIPSWVLMRF